MAVFAEDVPEADGRCGVCEATFGEVMGVYAALQGSVSAAGAGHAGEVAFDVGSKYGDAHAAECLGHVLQRARLARAGGAGDESVAVGHLWEQADVITGRRDGDQCVVIVVYHKKVVRSLSEVINVSST